MKDLLMQSVLFDQIMLGVLAVAFVAWAGVVWHGLREIAGKFDSLRTDVMNHLLGIERRLSCLEEQNRASLKRSAKLEEDKSLKG